MIFFDITVFFYNPNISEASEYQKRKEELKRFFADSAFLEKKFICRMPIMNRSFFEKNGKRA